MLSGLISRKGLLLAIAAVNLLDLGILLFLTEVRGWPVAAFALMGLFIAVFYLAPPLKLKLDVVALLLEERQVDR